MIGIALGVGRYALCGPQWLGPWGFHALLSFFGAMSIWVGRHEQLERRAAAGG